MFITIRSTSPVGVAIDAVTQAGFLTTRPESERQSVERDLRAQQQIFDEAAAEIQQAVDSRELTALGQRAATARAIQKALTDLRPHEALVKQLQAAAAATRAKALEVPLVQRSAEVLMREREIRDRLANTDALAVAPQYLAAISSGDWEFVSAVERAPQSFPLVNQDILEMGAHAKLARSPLATEVAEQEALAYIYSSTVATVRTQLLRLAEAHMVSRSELELD